MAQQATWIIDPSHSAIEFSVKHMMIATVKGHFEKFEGKIVADPENLTGGSAEVEIDAASIDTRTQDRDQHLRTADFFDVENFPKITFRSTEIEAKPGQSGEYRLSGELTIRDVTRPVTLDVTYQGHGKDPWGGERIAFSAKGSVNRKDFGLNWNTLLETGGVLVGDQVNLSIDVEAVRQ